MGCTKTYRAFLILTLNFIIVCLFLKNLFAESPDMNMNATPNPVGSGARAMGMGGAFISIADDATAASWNPGGLLQLTKPEISFVSSYFTGNIDYETSEIEGVMEDHTPFVYHLNYCSAVIPFFIFYRNFVFSFNYQHLYEFSQDNSTTWMEIAPEAKNNITHRDSKHQRGSLNSLSPALAIQITPAFFLGLTCNSWNNELLDNGWENLTIQDSEGIDLGYEKVGHSEVYEWYNLSGFNAHLGFLYKSDYHYLWGGKRKFNIGGVIKTPFDADIQHGKQEIFYEKYPENPVLNNYQESMKLNDLTLKMPLSYGLGFSLDFSDSITLALDIYKTHWENYVIMDPNGIERSPINKKYKDAANITSTTQIRLGAEYLIQNSRRIIPLRIGIFYDPEPSAGSPDDIYGISLGTGLCYKDLFSLDFAYQFRFGDKKHMDNEDISSSISQHYIYASIIYYLF